MTSTEAREYLGGLVSHITFTYNGNACGVDPFRKDDFDMWCGDKMIKVHSIDEVMNLEFFDGKSLEEIIEDVDDLEY